MMVWPFGLFWIRDRFTALVKTAKTGAKIVPISHNLHWVRHQPNKNKNKTKYNLLNSIRVEVIRWFVQQEDFCVPEQGSGQPNCTLLSARQTVRVLDRQDIV